MARDDFDKIPKYRLYRKIKDIIHPSISKKNISNYKIVLDENLFPIRVFYPKKITTINGIFIYIPGDGDITNCRYEYSNICSDLAIELDKLIIAIDYFEYPNIYPGILDKMEQTVKYLYDELCKNEMNSKNIIFMGDSTGANFVSSITFRFIKNNLDYIQKEILLYPILSRNYYDENLSIMKNETINNQKIIKKIIQYMNNYVVKEQNLKLTDIFPLSNDDYSNYPSTLIITGDLDPLKDEGKNFYNKLNNNSNYKNIKYVTHGFMNSKNLEVKMEFLNAIKTFI